MRVVAISTQDLADSKPLAEELGLQFPLASDAQALVTKRYGVYDEANEIAWPAVFIVDAQGAISWSLSAKSKTERPTVDTILAELDSAAP